MIMTQVEESEEKCIKAIRQQEIIFENINKTQQDELKAYFNKIQDAYMNLYPSAKSFKSNRFSFILDAFPAA